MAFCPSVFKLSFGFRFFPYLGACLGEVDFDDLETRLLTFWVTFFGVVDFVDFEVLIYFLQCASFGGVDRFDPEARFCFFTVRLLQ